MNKVQLYENMFLFREWISLCLMLKAEFKGNNSALSENIMDGYPDYLWIPVLIADLEGEGEGEMTAI